MISRSVRLSSAAFLLAFATATSASGQMTLDVKNALTIGSLSSSESGLQTKPGWSLETGPEGVRLGVVDHDRSHLHPAGRLDHGQRDR